MIMEYIFLALESKVLKDQEIVVFSGFNETPTEERGTSIDLIAIHL